jgi:hypothetical protein
MVWGTGDPGFKSPHPDPYRSFAALDEDVAYGNKVVGSAGAPAARGGEPASAVVSSYLTS